MRTEITRQDEEKFLKAKLAENAIFSNALTYNQVIDSIVSGALPLEVSEDDGTKIIDDSCLEEIKRVLPFLRKISEKPRSFIKSLEEKVPVETAKRINHKAIMKLSRDSNDWYARTVLAVKPKNVVSDISEETIDLYENRFVCCLVDRIARLLSQAKHYYQDQLKLLDDYSAVIAISKEYNYSTASFPFFNQITKKSQYIAQDNDYRQKLSNELDSILGLEHQVRIIKRSDFYRFLHKKQKVHDPIQKTNILMFEFNYNQAYKLWMYLNKISQEEMLDLRVEATDEELQRYYFLYSFVCLLAAFHDMGFHETSGGTFRYEMDNLLLDKEWSFERQYDNTDLQQYKVSLTHNAIVLKYIYSKNGKNLEDEFRLIPNYTNFEPFSRSQAEDYSAKLLDSLVIQKKDRNNSITGQYALVSVNMTRCAENNSYSNKVYRRFYGAGNNFAPTEDKLQQWGNYQTGIVMIAPTDLRYNFLRLEKILNYHILRWIDFSEEKTNCPVCGKTNVSKGGKDGFYCYDCALLFTYTHCNKCDPQHKSPILWIKYLNDKFLSNEEIVKGLNEMTPYYKMSKIETIMGEKATTSFELEKESSGWKLKTNCPCCGIQLGER